MVSLANPLISKERQCHRCPGKTGHDSPDGREHDFAAHALTQPAFRSSIAFEALKAAPSMKGIFYVQDICVTYLCGLGRSCTNNTSTHLEKILQPPVTHGQPKNGTTPQSQKVFQRHEIVSKTNPAACTLERKEGIPTKVPLRTALHQAGLLWPSKTNGHGSKSSEAKDGEEAACVNNRPSLWMPVLVGARWWTGSWDGMCSPGPDRSKPTKAHQAHRAPQA
ncbi:hypothetical protein B0H65DRAFT_134666 [Neurospora tetraspora]|uniref:Uncharacterized protein n=1 Tax=Neurospora tetraspora TaxID=94610 RepID=A0AAE0JLU5_9PEZI|nr:hypothetical protein B0H65DRAFT_134666 [Neurospora tetraspora]